MAIQVQMSIGLRDDRGVVFGTLQRVSDRNLQVNVAMAYEPGQRIEFQFPLEGYRASALGQATVRRVIAAEAGLGPTGYVLGIVEWDQRSEAVFREWLYDQAHGGGSPSRPHERLVSSIVSSVPDAAGRSREGQRRLDALDAARARRDTNSTISAVTGSGSGLRRGVGRAAMREALRGWAEAPGGKTPPPSQESTASARRVQGGDSGPQSLEVRLAGTAQPLKLLVRFHDRRRFLDMYRDHLDRDVLFVRCDDVALPAGAALTVRLAFPGGDVLLTDGVLLASLPSGLAVQLQLSSADRDQVREAAMASQRALHRVP